MTDRERRTLHSLPHKRFVLVCVLGAVLGLGCAGLFNALIDPIGAYPAVHLQHFEPLRYLRYERVAKAEMARKGDWEVAILGSSRAKGGIPAEHPFLATNRTCNLSVDAARFTELALIFDYATKENRLKHVLLCIDFYMFSDGPRWVLDFPESRFNPEYDRFLYHCKRLFSEESFAWSWEALTKRLKGRFPATQSRYGFYNPQIPSNMSQRELFDRVLRTMGAGYAMQKSSASQLAAFRALVETCRAREVQLTVAILPVHALDLELLYEDGRWAEFTEWKGDLAKAIGEAGMEGRIALWDFTAYKGPQAEKVPAAGDTTTRMKYYFENSHFTPFLGGMLLDTMYGTEQKEGTLGRKLVCGNVEEQSARLLEERAIFVRENGGDVAWVQRIMKEVAPRKKAVAGVER